MCVCLISENKHPFKEFCSLINCILLIFLSDFNNVKSDYLLMFLCAGDMTACGALDRVIQITIFDRHLSEGVHSVLLLGDDSSEINLRYSYSATNLRSYNS